MSTFEFVSVHATLATRYTVAKKIDLEAIVSKYYAALYRFGFALAKNESDAADLTQETFLLLTKHQNQIREPERIKSWLFITLRREFLRMNRIRTANPEVEFQPDDHKIPAMEPDVLRSSDGRTAFAALEKVQENYRPAVELFYLADLSYKEIAATLGVPIGTIMSRLSRGKEQLKRHWQQLQRAPLARSSQLRARQSRRRLRVNRKTLAPLN